MLFSLIAKLFLLSLWTDSTITEARDLRSVANDPRTEIIKTPSSGELTQDKDTPVSVFYNIYMAPNDAAKLEHAKEIFQEQITQVAESGLRERKNVKFHIVTIGAPVDDSFLMDACKKIELDCVHLKHYDEGFEMLTQQHLLDYCKAEENESHTVSYIHAKGSFHPGDYANTLRKRLTQIAISDECLTMLDNKLGNSTCNACGGNFKMMWGPLFWANMWSAKCEYVKKLISPLEIEAKLKEAYDSKPKEMTAKYYGTYKSNNPAAFGKNRYAAEVWVGTHPSLLPCGTLIHGNRNKFLSADDPTWKKLPLKLRIIPPPSGNYTIPPDLEVTDWHLIPGLLWRYYRLYREMPPSDSWIWENIPGGKRWKDAVEKLGFPRALSTILASGNISTT